MSIEVCWVPYGRAAAAALHSRLAAAKRDDALRPVTVLVPTNYVGVSTRRLLASGQLGAVTSAGAGLAGVTLLTGYRLAELLGAPRLAAAARRPVTTPVLAAAVRRALAADPGRFAPVAEHPATERALVRAHRELSDLTEASLDSLAATGDRAADVVRLHRRVRDNLAADWYVEADLMRAATAAVRAGSPILPDIGALLVYLPQNLAGPMATLLRAVAEATEVTIVAGRTGSPAADHDVERSIVRVAGTAPSPADPPPPAATEVISVSDAEEEVRAAVRRVLRAVRGGTRLERIALVYPSPEPYARLAHEALDAAGVPYNGAAVRPLTDRLLGRWILDALRLRDRGYRRQDVLDLLAAAPVRTRNGNRAPVAAWERVSRAAGVTRGRSSWDERLRGLAERNRAEAERVAAEDDPRLWLCERLRREAGAADALRGFAQELFRTLDTGSGKSSWAELVEWVRGLVQRYLGEDRSEWPQVERIAAERVETALDKLAVLDIVEEQVSPVTFRRTLELELDEDLGRVGRLGQGLLVGQLSTALGLDLDLVIVLGCAEGVLPPRVREDSLLPDIERAAVADELPPRAARVHVSHRHLLAALAASGSDRVLCYPRGDLRRSTERPPSRWLLDAVAGLRPDVPPGERMDLPRTAPWLTHSPSFAGSVRAAPVVATPQEHALRALSDHRGAGGDLADHPQVAADPVLAQGLALIRARRSDDFTRFDGNLSALRTLVPSPTADGATLSPTRLEKWAACPHGYLLEHVLRVQPVENPEELLEISPMDKGSVMHDALEAWLREHLDRPPVPGEAWSAEARERLQEHARRIGDEFEAQGLTGHPLMWGRDRARLLLDLDRFIDEDDERRRSLGVVPAAAEIPFGLEGREPVEIVLADGRTLRLRGRIDRLDVAPTGRIVVTDYKTGSVGDANKLSPDNPLLSGTKLQLPIYALAARAHRSTPNAPVQAEYWFITTKHGFKRHGYELSGEVLDRLDGVLATIVDGIEQGYFPARPAEPKWRPFVDCVFCDPDGLGTADRWRDWERKRHDPALAAYGRLIDPEAESEVTR